MSETRIPNKNLNNVDNKMLINKEVIDLMILIWGFNGEYCASRAQHCATFSDIILFACNICVMHAV